MLKLFEHPFSPYVQKVKIALYEKNVAFDVEVPDTCSGAPTGFATTNAGLEVPALVDDDFAIFDSTIILDYVEEKWPAPALLPSTPRERARVRMIEDVCDTYYEAINWGLMEVRAWKRVTGDTAKQLETKASEQIAGVFAWLERELGTANYFNGASFGYGDLSVYPQVRSSIIWGNPPKPGTRLAAWVTRVEERPSVRKTIEAAQQFADSMDSLPPILESGAFARQYRDHPPEWMMRSSGAALVLAGLKKETIRFSHQLA